MSKQYPSRLFWRRGNDFPKWEYVNHVMWVIRRKDGEWEESHYDDPDHLADENSDIEEIDSEGLLIPEENTGPEWDEDAMMSDGKL